MIHLSDFSYRTRCELVKRTREQTSRARESGEGGGGVHHNIIQQNNNGQQMLSTVFFQNK